MDITNSDSQSLNLKIPTKAKDFAMFTEAGNIAVKEAVDALVADGPVPWESVCDRLGGLPFSGSGDTQVRDYVFEYLGHQGLVLDIKQVATRPGEYPEPLTISD